MRPQNKEAAALCPSGRSAGLGRASCLVCVRVFVCMWVRMGTHEGPVVMWRKAGEVESCWSSESHVQVFSPCSTWATWRVFSDPPFGCL